MITKSNAEWVLLSQVYHHVLSQSPSPEFAKFEISAARRNGQLRLRAELHEHKAQPGLRLAPGEKPPETPPVVTSDYAIPSDMQFNSFDWERSRAMRHDAITKSLFEYVGIVVHRDDVLARWPAESELSTQSSVNISTAVEGGEQIDERIARVKEFKQKLIDWEKDHDAKKREWLNQNMHAVRRETIETGTHNIMTISPPPAVGGLVMRIDPFDQMFDRPWLRSMVPHITDMLDKTIGVLRNPPPEKPMEVPRFQTEVQRGYAFVAMPMDKNDQQLVDVLEAIKAGAKECGITAERTDDAERNERITDRILESIGKAEFVIVDLTNERPNVFYEAGYAHGIGKIPIYIARDGTNIQFNVKDYPVIIFRNMKELREGIAKRLLAIATKA